MVLFLHPTWSKGTLSSLGSQCIWAFVTWMFWTAGAATVDNAAPALLSGNCSLFVHCHHLRTMFGKWSIETFAKRELNRTFPCHASNIKALAVVLMFVSMVNSPGNTNLPASKASHGALFFASSHSSHGARSGVDCRFHSQHMFPVRAVNKIV